MATNFPGSLDTATQQPAPSSTTDLDATGYEHDVVHTNHSGAIIALETKLGTTDSDPINRALLVGTGTGTTEWDYSPTFAATLDIATATDNYTLVIHDAAKIVNMNKGSAVNLTVPPNSSVAFTIGSQGLVNNYGAGQVTIVAGSGVTLRSDGSKLKIASQYSAATLVKIGTDEWMVFGNLSA